jgi:hypothetical protein
VRSLFRFVPFSNLSALFQRASLTVVGEGSGYDHAVSLVSTLTGVTDAAFEHTSRDCNCIAVDSNVRFVPPRLIRMCAASLRPQFIVAGTDASHVVLYDRRAENSHNIVRVRRAAAACCAGLQRLTLRTQRYPHKGMVRAVAFNRWMLATGSSDEYGVRGASQRHWPDSVGVCAVRSACGTSSTARTYSPSPCPVPSRATGARSRVRVCGVCLCGVAKKQN